MWCSYTCTPHISFLHELWLCVLIIACVHLLLKSLRSGPGEIVQWVKALAIQAWKPKFTSSWTHVESWMQTLTPVFLPQKGGRDQSANHTEVNEESSLEYRTKSQNKRDPVWKQGETQEPAPQAYLLTTTSIMWHGQIHIRIHTNTYNVAHLLL